MPLYRIVGGVKKRIPILPGAAVPQPQPGGTDAYPAVTRYPSTTTYPKAG